MLKTMRNNTKIVLWVVIAAFLGTIVFAWGMQYTASEKMRNYVAKVNGREITSQEYGFYYDRAQRQWEQQNPNTEITEDQRARFYQQAWSDVVRDVLLQQEMKRYGIRINNAEVVEFLQKYYFAVPEIMQVPAFQTNGQFDYNKYIGLMNSKDPQAAAFWSQIEALVRPQLLEFKLTNAIFSTARMTDEDVLNRFREYHEYYRVKWVLVRADQFRPQLGRIPDDELKAELKKDRESYRHPERAIVKFVRFAKASALEDEGRVEDELLQIRREVVSAADSAAFAALAKKYSQDPTAAQNGGDMGWFGRGEMVPPFDTAAFAMKPGGLSQPVRTQFGWHLIKLWGKKKEKTGDKVHAGHILLKVEPSAEGLDRLRMAAEDFTRAAQGEGFEKAAAARNLRIDSSNIFTREATISGLGAYAEINEFVFTHKPGAVSHLFNRPEDYAVVKVEKRLPAGVPAFEHIKNQVRGNLLRRRTTAAARRTAQDIWELVQRGMPIDSAAARLKQPVASELIWGWGAWVPSVGDAPGFLGAVIRAHQKKEKYVAPVPIDLGYILGEVMQFLPYDPGRFAAAKDSTAQSLMQKRRTDAYNTWIANLQRKAEIKDYRMEVLGANF